MSPCCSSCKDGKPCEGMDVSMYLGAAMPGAVIADLAGFGMRGTLALALASYYVIHSVHEKEKLERFVKPMPLLFGGAFYFILKSSGQSPQAAVILALLTTYAWGVYEKRPRRTKHSARLGGEDQFLHFDEYRQIHKWKSLDEKV